MRRKRKNNLVKYLLVIIIFLILIGVIFYFATKQEVLDPQGEDYPIFMTVTVTSDTITYTDIDPDVVVSYGAEFYNRDFWCYNCRDSGGCGVSDIENLASSVASFDFLGKSCYLNGAASSGGSFHIEGNIEMYSGTSSPGLFMLPGCRFSSDVNALIGDSPDFNSALSLVFKQSEGSPCMEIGEACTDTALCCEGLHCIDSGLTDEGGCIEKSVFSCTQKSDCGPHYYCDSGICTLGTEPICTSGEEKCDVFDYYLCESDTWVNKGVTIGKCNAECINDGDCLTSQTCESNKCKDTQTQQNKTGNQTTTTTTTAEEETNWVLWGLIGGILLIIIIIGIIFWSQRK